LAVDVDGTCAQSADVQCQKFETCAGRFFARTYQDGAQCRRAWTASCRRALLPAAVAATSAVSAGCLLAVETESCEAYLEGETPVECRPRDGVVALGATCTSSGQCQPQLYCSRRYGEICGKCAPRVALDAGCPQEDACV